ncbi:hypothetical protein PVK06_005512 [Gossypium arboreum]|uniref:Uncharacterized protein n=1 Tax=Gossypium arboreum TaxID=29729 RepID=A0ABR0QVS4_GOSAR|nr:hypothetical protein PVK06_005512 [Gossypium arboreum]
MWKAPWMAPNEVLYHCGSFDWVPLPRIWGVVGYAPLLVLRAGLGKSSEQWQQGVQEERAKAEYWEKKFQEMQAQNQALEKENQ